MSVVWYNGGFIHLPEPEGSLQDMLDKSIGRGD